MLSMAALSRASSLRSTMLAAFRFVFRALYDILRAIIQRRTAESRSSPRTSTQSSIRATIRCRPTMNRLISLASGSQQNYYLSATCNMKACRFPMTAKTLKTITDRSGKRRVDIYQRTDGSFGFEDWEFGSKEGSWYPVGRYSHAAIDTLENAEKEARSRIQWLADESIEQ